MKGPLSPAAAGALVHAGEEAARRGDRRVGTDHLLLGLLHDPAVRDVLGVDAEQARAAGQDLDLAALATVGIDLDVLPEPRASRAVRHLPLTSGLRAVLARGITLAQADHARTAAPRHLLAALQERRPPDPAAALLAAMHIGAV